MTDNLRKKFPLYSGCLRYFPDALMAVAEVSKIGNEQHNPGMPLHWDRSKSTDEPDALLRHLKDAGTLDSDGLRHSAKVAWRALALLQKEIEAGGHVHETPERMTDEEFAAFRLAHESATGPQHIR
jgi:hypothetical protein